MALPAAGKRLGLFQDDDRLCRTYAGQQAASQATTEGYSLQQIYDTAYTQCMYAHGNTVSSPPTSYALGSPYQYADLYPYPYPPFALAGPPFFGGGIFVFGDRRLHHFDHFHHFHHSDDFHRFDHFQHFDGFRHR